MTTREEIRAALAKAQAEYDKAVAVRNAIPEVERRRMGEDRRKAVTVWAKAGEDRRKALYDRRNPHADLHKPHAHLETAAPDLPTPTAHLADSYPHLPHD